MASDQHFYFKYFPRKYFSKQNIFKITRPFLAALSVNGLTAKGMGWNNTECVQKSNNTGVSQRYISKTAVGKYLKNKC